MKTIKTTIAILALSIFTISCSKDDAQPPSAAISFENATEVAILDAFIGSIFSGGLITIVENPKSTESNINVTANGTILDLKKVILEMNISHTNQEDLSFSLIAPDGTESLFIQRVGDTSDYILENKLRFSAAFTDELPNTNVNFASGNYKESQGLGSFATPVLPPIFSTLQNKNINGNWKLKATDSKNIATGVIQSWKLIFEEGALNQ